jgi:hypothetical protein
MITPSRKDGQRMELERLRSHTRIANEWKANGRHTWSDAEIESAVDADLARRYPPKPQQMGLPGMPAEVPVTEPEPSTKAMAFNSYDRKAGTRRNQIYDLLDRAGARGMTREELAEALEIKEGGVTQPVRQMIDSREACEPFKRESKARQLVAVVVLAKHWRQA